MADIDFFKKVNDTYGHLTGDYTLKHFSEIISKNLKRESDWVARYGGEEFLMCLPSAGPDYAKEIAENIRQKIEDSEFVDGEHQFKITASFGVCSMNPSYGSNIEAMIECADRNLYKAKE